MNIYFKRGIYISLIIVLALIMGLAGCSDNGSGDGAAENGAEGSGAEGSVAAGSGAESDGDTVTLSYVTFQPSNAADIQAFTKNFVDVLNERGEGSIAMEYRGGPDVFAPMDMGEAVKNDAVDIAVIYFGAYESVAPGVGGLMLSQLEPEEEMDVAMDYIEELHNAGGLHFIMRSSVSTDNFFYTYLKNPVSEFSDLKNVLIGSSTGGKPAVEAWGATWTAVEANDSFTALEQGVAEGIAGQPLVSAESRSLREVSDYVIDHPYYKGTSAAIMNLDKWNSLSDEQKKLMSDLAREAITNIKRDNDVAIARVRGDVEGNDLTFIKFSDADAEQYVQSAYNRGWEQQTEKYPQQTPKLRKLLTPAD
ncbi:MAG: TRAP transporter substrate-binding protein DctP [Clostridiales Family XIII bacterium]|nr:TRAP transporter substrate-binding protein DctP [Clostridiales Family XIII bacterium]